MIKETWEERAYFISQLSSYNLSLQEFGSGMWKQEISRGYGEILFLDLLNYGLFSLLSYAFEDHTPRGSIVFCGMCPPRANWWEEFSQLSVSLSK